MLCGDPDRGVGCGGGGRLKRGGVYIHICIVVWQKPTQHCKAIVLQLEKKEYTT